MLLEIDHLTVRFRQRGAAAPLVAADAVSFRIAEGESVGLVGESGSGKTTVANAIVGLVKPALGTVRFRGRDVAGMTPAERLEFRRSVQMIFQDPAGSLNPRMTVGRALAEVLVVHEPGIGPAERDARVRSLLERVGLHASHARRYPHELSGGQRQRVAAARALAVSPRLLIGDEPLSALDVSVQVQLMNLLKDLHRQMGLAILLISHDLAVVRYMCRSLHVMHCGRIVESGPTERILSAPSDPYTAELVASVPDLGAP
jgi:ABC-type glutathione transport system ATPase component